LKIQGNGKAKVLTPAELSRLFTQLKKTPRNACLYAICFYTACRISEARYLLTTDITNDHITFRRAITKGHLKTRTIPINCNLRQFLVAYQPKKLGAMFPGKVGVAVTDYLSSTSADRILKQAARRGIIQGVSSHSFRRTALTYMYRSGIPLRTIQEISGHANLATLQIYLEVLPEDVERAINVLNF